MPLTPANLVMEQPLAGQPEAAQARTRVPELDVLRGFLLVWMTCTHLPTRFSSYSNQTFGYVSAAEGFIFLAAFLTGQVQQYATIRYGEDVALRRLFRRALRIYRYHAALLATAFTAAAAVAVSLDRTALRNLLDFYLASPKLALPAAAALVYAPPLFDILPIYILFTLATPALLWIARKRGWSLVLACSGAVWLLAQCNFRQWLYATAMAHGFPVPMHEAGAFDLFAWQFLWTIGLALGTHSFGRSFSGRQVPRCWLWVSGFCAASFFVTRHSGLDVTLVHSGYGFLVDKWKLGALRLVDLAALGLLLGSCGPLLKRWKWAVPLAPLGRCSLEVFSAHVLCCIAALALSHDADPHFTWWQDVLILAAAIAILFWVAHYADRRRRPRLLCPDPTPRDLQPAGIRTVPSPRTESVARW